MDLPYLHIFYYYSFPSEKNSGSGTFYGKVFRFKEKQYKCIN
ncbi:hypothetical protein CUZ96_2536 [Enterococcus lactis]|nr:hypothetical protein [Enterococcus lactis]MBL5012868.1 hypothetical protein [Enterococcus lactis]